MRINRPDRANALSLAAMEQLTAALKAALVDAQAAADHHKAQQR